MFETKKSSSSCFLFGYTHKNLFNTILFSFFFFFTIPFGRPGDFFFVETAFLVDFTTFGVAFLLEDIAFLGDSSFF